MPKGLGGVREVSKEIEARRGSGGPSALFFRLAPGEEAIVRFLEQDDDVAWAMVHEVPVEGRSWGRPVVCVNQERDGTPCPGCERELPLKFRGYINMIWFNAPVLKRDENGRAVKDSTGDYVIQGKQDQVAVWSSGIKLFENLDEINANFRGLKSRRFKVKRKGEGLSTTYSIAPEDVDSGAQEFSASENELASNKTDLSAFVKPPTYEEFLKELGQGGDGSGGNGSEPAEQRRRNPFMRS